MKSVLLLLLTLMYSISFASAIDYPRIEPYVNDFADVLSHEQETQLNMLADLIEQNTSVEIAIVTLTNTQGMDRIEYANHIGDWNGVGKKDKDNGVVILYSLDNERGGAIAVGRGIESTLNDAKVARIGREHKPLFDDGKYAEGFTTIVKDIESEIKSPSAVIDISQGDTSEIKNHPITTLLIILFCIGLFLLLVSFLSSSGGSSSSSSSSYRSSPSSRSSRPSSSSYRPSRSSFGGGSFGGGGARF